MEHSELPKKDWKRMTVDQFRKFKGLENHTDEEAEEIIIQLEKFSVIAFELWQKSIKEKESNQENLL